MAISNRTMSVPLLAVAFALLLPGGDAIRMMAGTKAGRRGGGAAKGKKVAPAAKLGGKGFGSALAAKKGAGGGVLLTEPRYEALYEWLRTSPETNLKKVGVGEFDGLRGVMALQDIAAGEEIVGIPAAFAVNLGTESADPLPAARGCSRRARRRWSRRMSSMKTSSTIQTPTPPSCPRRRAPRTGRRCRRPTRLTCARPTSSRKRSFR